MSVRPKKYLGQHFLTDQNIAQNIADTLLGDNYDEVLEIGPGMGVLTKYLLQKPYTTSVIEIDSESVEFLKVHYAQLENRIIEGDFLKLSLRDYFKGQVAVIGNFPYNISSQILFKVIEQRDLVPGNILVRQRGTTHHPGDNVYLGKDHTLHAKVDGVVRFTKKKNNRSYVSIDPCSIMANGL